MNLRNRTLADRPAPAPEERPGRADGPEDRAGAAARRVSRLILVSNRLPVTVQPAEGGGLRLTPSAGGLATGLRGPHLSSGGLWIGWPGPTGALSVEQRDDLERQLELLGTVPLHLSAEEVRAYYEGMSNGVIWPLFHYNLDRIPLHSADWAAYVGVNRRFAELTASRWRPGDLIWVHDYQLALVPGMLRALLPEARIGFFLHIPFPASEVYRTFPWRSELLRGLLGADLIGMHTLSYVRQFADALLHTLGLAPDVDRVEYQGRTVGLSAFPMGVDAAELSRLAGAAATQEAAASLRRENGPVRIIAGIDRLDYTKGIPRRLLAFERLLLRRPELRGTVRLVQVAVPSRAEVGAYDQLSQRVHETVGRINGTLGTATWVPIHYVHRGLSLEEVVAIYCAADVMLVTPLRDGMNLVAKEFVASRVDEDGVLVLSELAGAASEMGEALLVNPFDVDQLATVLDQALSMPRDERRVRMSALRQRIARFDVHRWAESFTARLGDASFSRGRPGPRLSSRRELGTLLDTLAEARALLWLLDYDGTLATFTGRPELARPDPALRSLLTALALRPGWSVHVLSGRSRDYLQRWLGDLPLGLHAEHGAWSRPVPGLDWTVIEALPSGWQDKVRPTMEQFVARAPGSFIEEKTCSLAWHYRMADPVFSEGQAKELLLHLSHTLSNLPVEVLAGDKVIEVHPHGVHKGRVVAALLAGSEPALPVALGDDQTDEALFAALPDHGVSIHVGPRPSRARYRLPDVASVHALLRAALRGERGLP